MWIHRYDILSEIQIMAFAGKFQRIPEALIPTSFMRTLGNVGALCKEARLGFNIGAIILIAKSTPWNKRSSNRTHEVCKSLRMIVQSRCRQLAAKESHTNFPI
jgi:hypothetical protein